MTTELHNWCKRYPRGRVSGLELGAELAIAYSQRSRAPVVAIHGTRPMRVALFDMCSGFDITPGWVTFYGYDSGGDWRVAYDLASENNGG